MGNVTLLLPTEETEWQREINANGKWRIFNGVAWVMDYDQKEKARAFAEQFGGTAIGKAVHNGEFNEYQEVEQIRAREGAEK